MATEHDDELVDILLERRIKRLEERKRIDAELEHIESFLAVLTTQQSVPAAFDVIGPRFAPRPSVREMLVALLQEDDRDWSAAEVLAEYESRGTPIHAKNPGNSVRSAIGAAMEHRTIYRTTEGRYKSSKWRQRDRGIGLDSPM